MCILFPFSDADLDPLLGCIMGNFSGVFPGQITERNTQRRCEFSKGPKVHTGLPRSWKSHGILTKNGQGHGKVIEFLNWSKKS